MFTNRVPQGFRQCYDSILVAFSTPHFNLPAAEIHILNPKSVNGKDDRLP